MKKKTWFGFFVCCVLVLMVSLAVAENENEVLTIQKLDVRGCGDYLRFTTHIKNTGNEGVEEFTLRLQFCNTFGEPIYDYVNTLDGFVYETDSLTYTPQKTITPGATFQAKESYFWGYVNAKYIKAAVSYYRTSDGTKHYIPESKLAWFVSGDGYISIPYSSYTVPSKQILDKTNYLFGLNYGPLRTEDLSYYYKKHAGSWVVSVNADSIAARCGLKTDDVIYSWDGILEIDDPFACEKAKAKIADGNEIKILVERNGETVELSFKK